MPNLKFDVAILHSDGEGSPEGYYWRMRLSPTTYGPAHGPFETDEKARGHATDFLADTIGKLARRDMTKKVNNAS